MSTQNVYHMVPKNLVGSTLYPLNGLRETMPAVYAEHVRKYEGREHLLARRLDLWDCLWNDAVQCAPVHPHKVMAAIREAGFAVKRSQRWFVIPVERLSSPLAIYHTQQSHTGPLPSDAVKEITTSDYRELDDVPPETKAWYAELKRDGLKMRGIFHRCPHVLTKAPIDITDCPIIDWID